MPNQGWLYHDQRVIPSDPQAGKQVLDALLAALSRHEWVERDIFSVHLAMEEALVNAIRHGNGGDPSKQVQVECRVAVDHCWIRICDEGPGFDPDQVPDPTSDERIDVPSGRGIMLMRNFMTRVEYDGRGNCVVMEKRRESASE
ncbi:MAG: ATP-binding protein [Pirellulales bacterium]|nr:ATP-binding protein [Pirellulales bacterium]